MKLGRFLSLVLRHNPGAAGISLDGHGWADVEELLAGVNRTGRRIDKNTLERIVRENNKQRYAFNEDHTKIRANQGHSLQVDVELKPTKPPRYLYHGTASRFLPKIQREGIRSMSRHGIPVVLTVDARAMAEDGILFYRSENGVWLCEEVAPRYFVSPGNS